MTISPRRLTALLAPLALIGMLMAFLAGPAKATNVPGVQEFEANVSTTQAGGHPNVALHFKVAGFEPFGVDPPCGKAPECLMPKTFHTHFPTGFIGNPHVVPKCTLTDYNQQACPSDAQVGVMDVGGALQAGLKLIVPVYNMETRPDQAGLLAFFVPLLSSPVFLELSGRTDSDYGLDVISSGCSRCRSRRCTATSGACPRTRPRHPALRHAPPGPAACFEQSAGPPAAVRRTSKTARRTRVDGRRLHDPAASLPAEPDHLRRAADDRASRSGTTTAKRRLPRGPARR